MRNYKKHLEQLKIKKERLSSRKSFLKGLRRHGEDILERQTLLRIISIATMKILHNSITLNSNIISPMRLQAEISGYISLRRLLVVLE